MKMKIYISIIMFALFGLLGACSPSGSTGQEMETDASKTNERHDHGEAEDHEGHDHGEESGEVHLSRRQMETVGVVLGDFTEIKINDYIPATGGLGLPPKSYSSVSAKTNGFIKNCGKYVEGSFVKKGQRIAHLENPDLIEKQREYLEVKAELQFLNQELVRHRKLVEENAGVLRNLQKLESKTMVKTARLKGLAKQLAYLGIRPDQITPDNITERIAIIAPMTGYATSVNIHDGMFVTPELVLMNIANEDHLHLELDVFEKDMAGLKEGQKITYTSPALGSELFEGEVHVIGKEFNAANKTLRVHGHLDGKHPKFIKDLFVDAKIWLDNKSMPALPDDAIINDGGQSLIYVADPDRNGEEVVFEKVIVLPGPSSKGYTSVRLVDSIPDNMKIVTSGTYYVYAQSQAGELEHEH